MGRLFGARGLTRFNRRGKLSGTALTVKTRGGDNLLVYKALTMIEPGHVLVIDAQGDTNNAVIGELIKLHALERGCAGFVVDGAIRDVAAFESTPCYARGVSHRGPYKNGPGETNVAVSIGGMVVQPGDIVIGDEDGLVAVPQAYAREVAEAAAASHAREEDIKREIASGAVHQSWLDSVLLKAGLEQ
jgi:regulator of RNase E activity RraA